MVASEVRRASLELRAGLAQLLDTEDNFLSIGTAR